MFVPRSYQHRLYYHILYLTAFKITYSHFSRPLHVTVSLPWHPYMRPVITYYGIDVAHEESLFMVFIVSLTNMSNDMSSCMCRPYDHCDHQGLLLLLWINFNPRLNNHTQYKVWDEITYLFSNFEVWWWVSNFIPQFTEHLNIFHAVIELKPC